MPLTDYSSLTAEVAALPTHRVTGRVTAIRGGLVQVEGLARLGAIGDRVSFGLSGQQAEVEGEIIALHKGRADILTDGATQGISLGDRATLSSEGALRVSNQWVGRVIDAFGRPLDGRPLRPGSVPRSIRTTPPAPLIRQSLGARLDTGVSVMDTFLPLVEGQRIGLFSGSGVGKSSLLGALARRVKTDVTVVALVGERGREVSEFVHRTLGPMGLQKSVVVAATSDQSPLIKRRAAWTAMTVAEHFRDQGLNVLLLMDSVTRMAEAHRDIATLAGEALGRDGFPASTGQMVMELVERAGPGPIGAGMISAVFSVLVAGSDMEGPIADLLRGVVDGHIVLSREIAERGRFPAVDVLASVSRSLPSAASEQENALLRDGRARLARYDRAELMIQSGLYSRGSDPALDRAVQSFEALDGFIGSLAPGDSAASFDRLRVVLEKG